MNESVLNIETSLLTSEISSLEQEHQTLTAQLETLNSEFGGQKKNGADLLKKLKSLKEKVTSFASERRELLYQKSFLQSENKKLADINNAVSGKYDENMKDLEDLMKKIGFMKGEIDTLQSKTQILEADIPFQFKDSENLDKRVKVTFFRALNNLQKRINDIQKKAEVIYYRKGEI